MNQIDIELYKVFANKELVEGCILTATVNDNKNEYIVSAYGKFNHTNIAVINRYFLCGFSHWADIETRMIRFDNGDIPFEILGIPPTIENVFQKAKEKKVIHQGGETYFIVDLGISHSHFFYTLQGGFGNDFHRTTIKYNPCITLLSQSDETKQELLNLFK